MEGYLHPDVLSSETEPHQIVMRSTAPAICGEGPARTSKTVRNLRKLFALHAKYPKFQSCIVRANAVDLNNTIRETIPDLLRYDFEDPRSLIKQRGGPTRFTELHFPGGGKCVLGGMSRPGSVLGGKYDLIFLNELSQFTLQQFQILKTRVAGDAANWRLDDGSIVSQMLCDTNPDLDDHWMYQLEADGLLEFVKFGFKDNPFFYRKGRWSRVGVRTVEQLDTLTGLEHDIYFKGLRVAPTGRVFNLKECHFVDELPEDLDQYFIYNAMDFGTSSPSVCLWIFEHFETQDVIVCREWRRTHTHSPIMAEEVKSFSMGPVKQTVIDNNEDIHKTLAKHGIPNVMTKKYAGSRMAGIHLIAAALKKTEDKQPGGLKFYRHLRCTSDSKLIEEKRPQSTIDEMNRLVYNDDKDDTDGERHGIDALCYYYLLKNRKKRMPKKRKGVVVDHRATGF